MALQPGCSLVVAPSFHLPIDWAQRIHLGAGIDRDEFGFRALPPWRTPNEQEMSLLVAGTSDGLPDRLCLFQLPKHLQTAWWKLLDRAQSAGKSGLDGFDGFVAQVADFLAFKDLPVPEGAAFDMVVSQTGQRSDYWSSTPLWGGINLGEEAAFLVFVNLPDGADQLTTPGSEYPPVRVRIEPGEGFRFPVGGLLADSWAVDKEGPDIWLMVRAQTANRTGEQEMS
jgi:hypothetical protein